MNISQVEAAPDVKERTAATVKLCSEKFGLSKGNILFTLTIIFFL